MNRIYILLRLLAKNILFCLFYLLGTIKVIAPNNLIQFCFLFHILKPVFCFPRFFYPSGNSKRVKSDKVTKSAVTKCHKSDLKQQKFIILQFQRPKLKIKVLVGLSALRLRTEFFLASCWWFAGGLC